MQFQSCFSNTKHFLNCKFGACTSFYTFAWGLTGYLKTEEQKSGSPCTTHWFKKEMRNYYIHWHFPQTLLNFLNFRNMDQKTREDTHSTSLADILCQWLMQLHSSRQMTVLLNYFVESHPSRGHSRNHFFPVLCSKSKILPDMLSLNYITCLFPLCCLLALHVTMRVLHTLWDAACTTSLLPTQGQLEDLTLMAICHHIRAGLWLTRKLADLKVRCVNIQKALISPYLKKRHVCSS